MTETPALTGALAEHPRLSQWVVFPALREVLIHTGKVELAPMVKVVTRISSSENAPTMNAKPMMDGNMIGSVTVRTTLPQGGWFRTKRPN